MRQGQSATGAGGSLWAAPSALGPPPTTGLAPSSPASWWKCNARRSTRPPLLLPPSHAVAAVAAVCCPAPRLMPAPLVLPAAAAAAAVTHCPHRLPWYAPLAPPCAAAAMPCCTALLQEGWAGMPPGMWCGATCPPSGLAHRPAHNDEHVSAKDEILLTKGLSFEGMLQPSSRRVPAHQ